MYSESDRNDGGRRLSQSTEPFVLPYFPLLIRLRCVEPAILPAYLGSTLHGILGWALLPHKEAYQYLFNNRRGGAGGFDIPNPYIIDVPEYHGFYQKGDELRFQFTLIGDAVNYSDEVIKAIVKTNVFGLGAERKKFQLYEIMQGSELRSIWTSDKFYDENIVVNLLKGEKWEVCSHCSLQLITPLRIRRKGELVKNIDFPTVIRNITNRMIQLTDRYGGAVNKELAEKLCRESHAIQISSSGISEYKLERYSSRRDKKMDVSGVLGAITFEGALTQFAPWLSSAELLHLGRNTTFGFGKVKSVFW